MPFPDKRNQGSLKKWLILGLKQENFKDSLEHLVSESKDVLEDLQDCFKRTQELALRGQM